MKFETLAPQNIAPQLVNHAIAGLERRGEWSIGVKTQPPAHH